MRPAPDAGAGEAAPGDDALDVAAGDKARAELRGIAAAAATRPRGLGCLLRSTPATALAVFAAVLATLVYLEG